MSEKILSISVAAYNVENYLDKLINSIIKSKRMEDIEVLIVNDGSTDKTAEIASKYQEIYPASIFLIDKPNGGHGSTINAGIINATGKYFKAIDGDDWFDTDGLSRLVDNLKVTETDVIFTDFINVYEQQGKQEIKTINCKPGCEYIFDNCSKELTGICYHNICYKTEVLKNNNIRLTEHSFYVDNELICYPIPYVKSFVYFDYPVYCYRLGREGQSVSMTSMQKNEKQHLNICENLLQYYTEVQSNMSEDKKCFMAKFISSVCEFQLRIQFSFAPSIDRINKIVEFDNLMKQIPLIYDSMASKTYNVWRLARRILYIPTRYYINKKYQTLD